MTYTKGVMPNKSIFMISQNRQNNFGKELEQWGQKFIGKGKREFSEVMLMFYLYLQKFWLNLENVHCTFYSILILPKKYCQQI